MKSIRRIYIIFTLLLVMMTGCVTTTEYITITNGNKITIKVGETIKLNATKSETLTAEVVWSTDSSYIDVDETGFLTALKVGVATVKATVGEYNDSIEVEVVANTAVSLTLAVSQKYVTIGDCVELNATVNNPSFNDDIEYLIKDGDTYASLDGNILTGKDIGIVTVVAKVDDTYSNTITIEVVDTTKIHSIKLTASKYYIKEGEVSVLFVDVYPKIEDVDVTFEIVDYQYYASLNNNIVTGVNSGGNTTFVAKVGNVVSNEITITVVDEGSIPDTINLTIGKTNLPVGESTYLSITTNPYSASKNVEYRVLSGGDVVEVIRNIVTAKNLGKAQVQAIIEGVESNIIEITVDSVSEDPYISTTKEEFYQNYVPANNYLDSYYRTLHNLMSGSIDDQDQKPTISDYQPSEDGTLYRNSHASYSSDMNTYVVVDSYGEPAFEVYRGGAYVTLEEVAAYVFAFGDVPANYLEKKSADPSESVWGEYLRLNHSSFSGSTSKYPYEPALPNIRGIGGDLYYYEIDLGTTGTDCDPNYDIRVYNDGKTITRGAARIVYTRYDANKDEIIDINEKYLFYTYNHYNDFQEYLNYEGGWGYIFGNITGGGTLSSKYDYNPTPYIPIILKDFVTGKYLN